MKKLSLLWGACCLISLPLSVDAADATLVKDIRALTSSRGELASGDRMAPVGQSLVFANNEGVYGAELWVSDGTTEGTRLLKDIAPGPSSSSPTSLIPVGPLVFFKATGSGNSELWRTDGTAAGTFQVKDICRGYCASEITALTALGSQVFFFAQDSLQGRQLWRSDGTEQGTYPLRPLGTATQSGPERMAATQDKVFFTFADATRGTELWVTDGTASGTRLVKDIAAGVDNADVDDLQVAGSLVFFTAHERNDGSELWRSDGTEAGTFRVKDLIPGTAGLVKRGVYRLRDSVVLMTRGPENTDVLYLARGQREDLVLIRDLGGIFDSSVTPVAIGDTLYFVTDHPATGRELWRTNGTAGGTGLVKDIVAGTGSSFPRNLTAVGGQLAFVANDGLLGLEVWRSNGTAAGTEFLFDALKGTDSGSPRLLSAMNGGLAFVANTGTGLGFYRSNLTTAGTRLVQSLTVSRGDSNPSNFAALGGQILFSANDGLNGIELWHTDATTSGTTLLKDLCPGAASSAPTNFVSLGDALYFVASNCNSGTTVYKTDGTNPGTTVLKDVGTVSVLQRIGNRLFLSMADTTAGSELWTSDGTVGGTVRVKDINPGIAGAYPGDFTALNQTVLFTALSESGRELWRTDGTDLGTQLVKDLEPGVGGSFPFGLTGLSDKAILFTTNDNSTALWVTDGTPDGTKKIGSFALVRLRPVVFGTVAYFVASDNQTGLELWKTDGTERGTVRVADIAEGKAASAPESLTVMGDALYFTAHTPEHGRELWKTTGTAEGTSLVAETFPGPESGLGSEAPLYATPSGTRLIFAAADPLGSTELWATDGISGHARRLADVAAGAVPSSPRAVSVLRDHVIFTADDGRSGFELFSIPLDTLDDLEPPQVTCPPTVVVSAASATGTVADYPPATGLDTSGSTVALSYSAASGSVFSVGTTSILVTATDAVGNQSTCEFDLVVQTASTGETSPPQTAPTGGCAGCSSVGFEWGPGLLWLGALRMGRRGRRKDLRRNR